MADFDWNQALQTGAGLLSSFYGANQLSNAANASNAATNAAVAAQQFKPYSITTGFGASAFNPETQQATYALSPQMEAFRNKYYGMASGALDTADVTGQQAAQNYMAQQQALLQPQRMQEDIALRNQQIGRGRIGLGLASEAAGGGAGGMLNPEQFNLNRARSLADQQLAANAYQFGQQDIDRYLQRASGLLQSGTGIESLGQQALTMGADLGKLGVAAGQGQAQSLLTGAQQANAANLMATSAAMQGLGNFGRSMGGLFTGGR